MSTDAQPSPAQSVSDRFLALITPRRRNPDRPPVEDHEYLEMLWRMVRALEARAANNPEMIIQMIALVERLAEAVNVAISISADRYALDPMLGASAGEIARLIGVSKQAVSQRRERGRTAMDARIEAAGGTKFSEAAREREAIAAAAQHAEQAMPEYRARHLRAVA